LPEITIKQIEHFFSHYKDLEPGKWVKINRDAQCIHGGANRARHPHADRRTMACSDRILGTWWSRINP
jgi:hypothetical protein